MQDGELYVLVVFVVDDIMIGSSDENFTKTLIQEFHNRYYKITDVRQPQYILGMHLYYDRDAGILRLNQPGALYQSNRKALWCRQLSSGHHPVQLNTFV